MRFPCEYVASEFLPGLRIRLAHILYAHGFSQTEIADKLGVKQPVVVSYLQAYKKRIVENKEDNIHLDTLAQEVADYILTGRDISFIMRTVCTRCQSLRVDSYICSKHKELMPELAKIKNCDICFGFKDEIPKLDDRAIIIHKMQKGFERLKEFSEFVEWVPEIGSQLASSEREAKRVDDVASFPGRIIKIGKEITTVREPEFGNSKTMSALLLWIKHFQPEINCMLSIKNKRELKRKLDTNNIPYLESKALDTAWNEKLEELSNNKKVLEAKALLDSGALGFEPIAYIFGKDFEEIEKFLKIILI